MAEAVPGVEVILVAQQLLREREVDELGRKEDPFANPEDAESEVQKQIEEATQYARSNLEPNDSVDEVLYILAPKITNTAARYSILSDNECTIFHLVDGNSVPKHETSKLHGCPPGRPNNMDP